MVAMESRNHKPSISRREWRLSELLAECALVDHHDDVLVTGLAVDSREIHPGMAFVALQGETTHGCHYIRQALAAGAVAVLCEQSGGLDRSGRFSMQGLAVPVIQISDLSARLGAIAARFYGEPSQAMFVAGITGTNGKTSCCQFLAQLLTQAQGGCGVIGTLGYGRYGALRSGRHTTPDAVAVQQLLAGMRDDGIHHAVMEVSSHALAQGRVNAVDFDVAVFTNLSRDHLDYHGDFDAYARAKQRLFTMPGLRYAVVNRDDAWGRELLKTLPADCHVLSYGLDSARRPADGTDIQAAIQVMDGGGFELRVMTPQGAGVLHSALLGRFNASNLLAVLAVLLLMDMPLAEALERLAGIHAVSGRMEHLGGAEHMPLVVIDYAHSPDALRQVLQTLRGICGGRLSCVFGCGGDRDRGKRPQMGRIAEQCADHVIITDDNPRNEEAARISADILAGMERPQAATVIHERAAAIEAAVRQAGAVDVVLIAGKGHEEYQIVADRRMPFSDRRQVHDVLAKMKEGGHDE